MWRPRHDGQTDRHLRFAHTTDCINQRARTCACHANSLPLPLTDTVINARAPEAPHLAPRPRPPDTFFAPPALLPSLALLLPSFRPSSLVPVYLTLLTRPTCTAPNADIRFLSRLALPVLPCPAPHMPCCLPAWHVCMGWGCRR